MKFTNKNFILSLIQIQVNQPIIHFSINDFFFNLNVTVVFSSF